MKHLWKTLLSQGKHIRQGWVALAAVLIGLQLWLASPVLAATTVADVPNITADPSTWVADEADVLSPIVERGINKTLSKVAKQTGNEIRMVTIRGLNYGVTPSSFTDELFAEWFPIESQQGKQTLLLLDTKTNDSAIRLGDQADIPTDLAQSLATESLLIPIRKGNYNQAFQGTADRVAAVLAGEADPGPPAEEIVQLPERNYKTAEETDDFNASIIVVVLLVVATIVPMATYFFYQSQ